MEEILSAGVALPAVQVRVLVAEVGNSSRGLSGATNTSPVDPWLRLSIGTSAPFSEEPHPPPVDPLVGGGPHAEEEPHPPPEDS